MKHYTFILIVMLSLHLTGCGKQPNLYQEATVRDSKIVIALDKVSDRNAHFFTYKKGGKRINFFIRTDNKGMVTSYFDACFTCYKHKKGYHQESANLICNECSMIFGLFEEKWEEKDGCNPIYLKSTLEGSNLVIDTAVIEKGAKLF